MPLSFKTRELNPTFLGLGCFSNITLPSGGPQPLFRLFTNYFNGFLDFRCFPSASSFLLTILSFCAVGLEGSLVKSFVQGIVCAVNPAKIRVSCLPKTGRWHLAGPPLKWGPKKLLILSSLECKEREREREGGESGELTTPVDQQHRRPQLPEPPPTPATTGGKICSAQHWWIRLIKCCNGKQ